MGRRLLHLMDEKQTNLSIAADVTTSHELLSIANELGPDICVLKTHIDIISDFTPSLTAKLREIADRHHFLIFEDRKFADIGNTVKWQYEGGIYRIASWADIINAHLVPGPGIIEGLREVGLPQEKGLLLLAEMSSKGTLASGAYTQKTVQAAEEYQDFCMGFIGLRKLSDNPSFVTMTPGVNLNESGDKLGQQYLTPRIVIEERGSDIIIVGRGIYASKDPKGEALKYRTEGWQAYLNRLKS